MIVLPYTKVREKELIKNLSDMREGSRQFEDQKKRIIYLKLYGRLSRGRRGQRFQEEEDDGTI